MIFGICKDTILQLNKTEAFMELNLEKNEVVKSDNKIAQNDNEITKEMINEYLALYGYDKKLNPQEKKEFETKAILYQLNPWKRELHCVFYIDGYNNRHFSAVTGYEVYLKRAERSGKLSGWEIDVSCIEKNNGKIKEAKSTIKIYRNDWKMPLIHSVMFSEYDQNNKMWNGKPITMIKKVNIAQGFRLAFPDELGGMPYTSDEMPAEEQQAEKNQTVIKQDYNYTKAAENEINQNNEKEKYELKLECKKLIDNPVWTEQEKFSWIEKGKKIKTLGGLKELKSSIENATNERLRSKNENKS
jgi:phage recombination protein Bet